MIYSGGPIGGVFVEEGGQLTTIKEVYVGPELIWQNRLPLIVHEIELTGMSGQVDHLLLAVAVPEGELWTATVQGEVMIANGYGNPPTLKIGTWTSPDIVPKGPGTYGEVNETRPIGPGQSIYLTTFVATGGYYAASFTGTITIDPNPV